MTSRRIEDVATELLSRSRVMAPPVPVHDLAGTVGATLRVGPLEGQLSGFLLRRADQTIIGVNSLHPRTRQRFTIAHELGHLLLHNYTEHVDRDMSFYFREARSSEAEIRQEIQANRFAAELLMPRTMIDAAVPKAVGLFDDVLLSDLADRFEVSVQAITYRLTNLGFSHSRSHATRVQPRRFG